MATTNLIFENIVTIKHTFYIKTLFSGAKHFSLSATELYKHFNCTYNFSMIKSSVPVDFKMDGVVPLY